MASSLFPNTVFVKGFPSSMSRYDFLSIFGGSKGHINAVDFTNTIGDHKTAFIQYERADSLPLALEMNGTHLFNYPYALNVRVVDEYVLCDHIPGEMYDVDEALVNLQQVLSLVLASRDQDVTTYRSKINDLAQANQHSLAIINELKKNHELYMLQNKGEERDMDSNLLRTVAKLHTTTDCCAKVEAENRVIEERMKEAGMLERELSSKLTLVSNQLEKMTGCCSQLQTEVDALRTRLTEVDSELKTERERSVLESKESENLRRDLYKTTAQKEQTIESLGLANNSVFRLQEELKTTQKTAEVSQRSLRSTRSSLEDMGSRVRRLQDYVTKTQTKRQRGEEDLTDERDAKRRLIGERETIETCCSAYEAEEYAAERQRLEERLRMETHLRKQTEESLAEANAKLDRVVVTDLLTAAFLKLDRMVVQLVEDTSPPDNTSR